MRRRLRVSRWTYIHWTHDVPVAENPLDGKQVRLDTVSFALVLAFEEWRDEDDAIAALAECGSTDGLKHRLYDLQTCGILIEEHSSRHDDECRLKESPLPKDSVKRFHMIVRTDDDTDFLSVEEQAERVRDIAGHTPPPSFELDIGTGEEYRLPAPPFDPPSASYSQSESPPFWRTLFERKTTRTFVDSPQVDVAQLATVLFCVAGAAYVKDAEGTDVMLKTSASGGARHPTDTFVFVRDVKGVPSGIYYYAPTRHRLKMVREGVEAPELVHLCGDQDWGGDASFLLFYVANVKQSVWKYRTARLYRIWFIDVGHLSQTCYLTSTALGLGCFFLGAVRDGGVEKRLGLDWSEHVVLGCNGVGQSALTGRAEGRQPQKLRPWYADE